MHIHIYIYIYYIYIFHVCMYFSWPALPIAYRPIGSYNEYEHEQRLQSMSMRTKKAEAEHEDK